MTYSQILHETQNAERSLTKQNFKIVLRLKNLVDCCCCVFFLDVGKISCTTYAIQLGLKWKNAWVCPDRNFY